MERLTYTDEELAEFENMDCPVKANDLVNRFCDRVCDEFYSNCPFKELGKKLKAYEDKEEQGLLIELPCKVGDTVYALTPFCEICEEVLDNEYACEICSKGNFVSETKFDYEMIPMFGKVVFATHSEAEEALAKMGGSHDRA